MKITINTQQLAKALKLVETIVSQKNVIPILGNVLLRTDMNEVHLSTTNHEISLTTSCPATVTEPGIITAPVKPLLDLVNQISEEQTHLLLEKGHVRVAAGAYKMRLQTLSADDFPQLANMPEGGLLIPGDAFKQMIKRVRYAISDSDKRYFMNGALLSLTEHAIALVTTDGKRLSLTGMKRTTPGASIEVVIPTKTLDVLLADESHEDILFNKDMRQMFFVSDDTMLTSRMIDGQFPNYKRVIPKETIHRIEIPRLQLLSAIKRVALASAEDHSVAFALERGALTLSAKNVLMGDAVEHLAVTYASDPLTIHFPHDAVTDFLDAATNQQVVVAFKDVTGAALWSDGDGREFMNVIMPMRG